MESAASTTQSLQQLPPISKEELWQESMVEAVDTIEAKYQAKYVPDEHDGYIHSAKVAVPMVDFARVKPHLHRNLPKPAEGDPGAVLLALAGVLLRMHHLRQGKEYWRRASSSWVAQMCSSL